MTTLPSRYSCAFVCGCSYRKSTRVSLFLRRGQPPLEPGCGAWRRCGGGAAAGRGGGAEKEVAAGGEEEGRGGMEEGRGGEEEEVVVGSVEVTEVVEVTVKVQAELRAARRHVFVISSCSDLSSACWRSSSRSFFHLSSFCCSFFCSSSAAQTFSTFWRLAVCHDFLWRKASDLHTRRCSERTP